MSSKLKLNSNAGGSLGLIIDDTLATDEEFNISNGGIESGSNANGSWTKFPDGTLICYGDTATLDGNIGVVTFPQAFILAPLVTVTASHSNDAGYYPQLRNDATTTTVSYYRYRESGSTTDGFLSNWIAIGRWK